MTKLISDNQTGFVKDRLITENVLLAQKIIQSISQNNRGGNIVIKLDMAKVYDRMSWLFITSVLRRYGFSELWIELVENIISGVWYSIIINGSRNGFFTSSQGLKQGDLLSPYLFILAVEVLSRSPNNLNRNNNFIPFSMPSRGPTINHL